MNYLFIESMLRWDEALGETFTVEYPTGSGTAPPPARGRRRPVGAAGRRSGCPTPTVTGPWPGRIAKFRDDPEWRELLLFHEYFHGDTGAGIGASHQTGWTGLVAHLLARGGPLDRKDGAPVMDRLARQAVADRTCRRVTAADIPIALDPVAAPGAPAVTDIPTGRLLVLFLLPGALAALVFILASGPVAALGFPPLMGLLVAIAFVIIPFELGTVIRASRQAVPGGSALASVPYRRPMRALDWAWLVPVLLLLSILGFGLVGVIEPSIQTSLFGFLPDWFVRPLPVDDVASFTRTAWIVTLVLFVALNVFAGPMTEELYFRGYLLPRMTRFGRAAPLLNAALFSLYHFWSPWQFLSRVAGVTPFAYGVWWKHNVYLGMAIHVLLNAIGTATVVVLILGRLG